jgi:hypothetical protein
MAITIVKVLHKVLYEMDSKRKKKAIDPVRAEHRQVMPHDV